MVPHGQIITYSQKTSKIFYTFRAGVIYELESSFTHLDGFRLIWDPKVIEIGRDANADASNGR